MKYIWYNYKKEDIRHWWILFLLLISNNLNLRLFWSIKALLKMLLTLPHSRVIQHKKILKAHQSYLFCIRHVRSFEIEAYWKINETNIRFEYSTTKYWYFKVAIFLSKRFPNLQSWLTICKCYCVNCWRDHTWYFHNGIKQMERGWHSATMGVFMQTLKKKSVARHKRARLNQKQIKVVLIDKRVARCLDASHFII